MPASDYTATPPEAQETSSATLFIEFEDQRLRVDKDSTTLRVGREDDNDLPILNRFVSRYHGAITMKLGRFIYADTSSNGTYMIDPEREVHTIQGAKVFLPDKGLLGLGYRPDKPEAAVLRFRIVDNE